MKQQSPQETSFTPIMSSSSSSLHMFENNEQQNFQATETPSPLMLGFEILINREEEELFLLLQQHQRSNNNGEQQEQHDHGAAAGDDGISLSDDSSFLSEEAFFENLNDLVLDSVPAGLFLENDNDDSSSTTSSSSSSSNAPDSIKLAFARGVPKRQPRTTARIMAMERLEQQQQRQGQVDTTTKITRRRRIPMEPRLVLDRELPLQDEFAVDSIHLARRYLRPSIASNGRRNRSCNGTTTTTTIGTKGAKIENDDNNNNNTSMGQKQNIQDQNDGFVPFQYIFLSSPIPGAATGALSKNKKSNLSSIKLPESPGVVAAPDVSTMKPLRISNSAA